MIGGFIFEENNVPCFQPLSAWRVPGQNGKSKIFFSKNEENFYDIRKPLDLPCGQCIGCRLERSRRWAVRLMHERQLHDQSCFITLTYSDDTLPKDGSLRVEDFQGFMHRLRKNVSRAETEGVVAPKIRFFHCGEYGEENLRPHYHACLFGVDFSADRKFYKKTKAGHDIFKSDSLTKLWGHGEVFIGELTFESAAYVARYCLKKVTNKHDYTDKKGKTHVSKETHYAGRKPEYVTMSRRPGIAADWFDRYKSDAYPSDSVVMRGKEMLPPPFYDKLLEKADPKLFEAVKRERALSAKEYCESPENSSRRLLDRKKVKEETIKNTLRRSV